MSGLTKSHNKKKDGGFGRKPHGFGLSVPASGCLSSSESSNSCTGCLLGKLLVVIFVFRLWRHEYSQRPLGGIGTRGHAHTNAHISICVDPHSTSSFTSPMRFKERNPLEAPNWAWGLFSTIITYIISILKECMATISVCVLFLYANRYRSRWHLVSSRWIYLYICTLLIYNGGGAG